MKIITIGGATIDIFITYAGAEVAHLERDAGKRCYLILEEGKKIEVQRVDYMTGGGATNAAASFKKFGYQVEAFFKIGSDDHGARILHTLNEHGINISHVAHTDTEKTGVSFIIPCPSGDRTVLVYRGASTTLHKDEIPTVAIQSAQLLYITSLSGPSSQHLPFIVECAKEKNIPVAVNPGGSQLEYAPGAAALVQALPGIDTVIVNSHEAGLLMGALLQNNAQKKLEHVEQQQKNGKAPALLHAPLTHGDYSFSLQQFFKVVHSYGPQVVVVTNGKEGVYVSDGKQILFHPSLPTEVVSTVGAGDAFGSCFVAMLSGGAPVEDAIRAGIINSCSVIASLGAKTGLLEKQELEKRIKELDSSLLQTFKM